MRISTILFATALLAAFVQADVTGSFTDNHKGVQFQLKWTVPSSSPDRIQFSINVDTEAW
jgi:hypothetical protein